MKTIKKIIENDYHLDSLENDDGDLVYALKQWRDGVGTRPSGKKRLNTNSFNYKIETLKTNNKS